MFPVCQWCARQYGKPEMQFTLRKKPIKSPTEIVCLASSLIMCWAGLHQEGERLDLEAGAEAMKATALHFHPRRDSGVEDDGAVVPL
jgi:hypothetical protein